MATDKSEPRIGAIVKVGVISVLTLVGVHAALVAYFDRIARAEERRKLGEATPFSLMSLHADEHERLTSGPLSIEKAMHEMAVRGRAAASPDIMPSASKDLAPLQGWTQMPIVPPAAMTTGPKEPMPPSPGELGPGDAGAANTGATNHAPAAPKGGAKTTTAPTPAPSKPAPKSP